MSLHKIGLFETMQNTVNAIADPVRKRDIKVVLYY